MYFFFFNDTATTEIYTLSLHDALPISRIQQPPRRKKLAKGGGLRVCCRGAKARITPEMHRHVILNRRSEEHTSELQSRQYLVCRLLLEKKKTQPCPASETRTHSYTRLL